MTTMDRYLGARIIATLLKTLLAFALLYVLIDFLTSRQRVVEKYDVPWEVIPAYYATHVPTFIFKFQALALALLVSTLFVLGKSAQDGEITALLAGGVSMGRIARVPVLVALILSGFALAFENSLGARCAERARQIEAEYFKRAAPSTDRGPSWTGLGPEDWTCHILHFNRTALTGTQVFMHAFNEAGMEEIRADRIYWDPDRAQWILEDGRWATIRRNPSVKDERRITQMPAPFPESPDSLFALEEPPESKTAGALHDDLKRADAMGMPTRRSWVAFHTKFSRPALCFVIVWLAIPFALRVRRGGIFLSFGLSIALGLAYVTLYGIGLGLGNLGFLPPPHSGLARERGLFRGWRGAFLSKCPLKT